MKKIKNTILSLVSVLLILTSFGCGNKVSELKNVELKSYDIVKNTVIYYGGDYCGYCREFKPNWDEVSEMDEYKNINFFEEKDVQGSVSFQFKIRTVPTIVMIDNEGKVTKINSYQSLETFKENLDKYLDK
jgi:thioredoxin-related protein